MSSAEENVAVVRAGLDAWTRGDLDAVMAVLDPEVEVHTPPEMVNAGTYRGHDGYEHWMGQWMEAWAEFELEVRGAEPVGERHVVVDLHQRATGRGSGVEVEMQIAQLYEVRDGRAVRFHIYPTRERALEVALEGEAERA
ncbi:MAG: nuclear transport factor 2 family protein [Actinomycetota bacterium]